MFLLDFHLILANKAAFKEIISKAKTKFRKVMLMCSRKEIFAVIGQKLALVSLIIWSDLKWKMAHYLHISVRMSSVMSLHPPLCVLVLVVELVCCGVSLPQLLVLVGDCKASSVGVGELVQEPVH